MAVGLPADLEALNALPRTERSAAAIIANEAEPAVAKGTAGGSAMLVVVVARHLCLL
jgi:hypothetical protein